MNESRKPISELELDQLMSQAGLAPPRNFEQSILTRLAPRTEAQCLAAPWFKPVRWLALLSGGAFALSELLAFMFGLWTASTAL